MKRHITGLRSADTSIPTAVPDGIFLVRVQRDAVSQVCAEGVLQRDVSVLEPIAFPETSSPVASTARRRALWKLSWFLRDFGYDTELLSRDEVDEKRAVGLPGVVKISHVVYDGMVLLRFDGFAPASRWEELSPTNLDRQAS